MTQWAECAGEDKIKKGNWRNHTEGSMAACINVCFPILLWLSVNTKLPPNMRMDGDVASTPEEQRDVEWHWCNESKPDPEEQSCNVVLIIFRVDSASGLRKWINEMEGGRIGWQSPHNIWNDIQFRSMQLCHKSRSDEQSDSEPYTGHHPFRHYSITLTPGPPHHNECVHRDCLLVIYVGHT
jgi:hypothetical protein